MEKRLLFLFLWVSGSIQTSDTLRLHNETNAARPMKIPRTFFGKSSENDSELIFLNQSAVNYLESSLSTVIIPVIYIVLLLVGIPANVTILLTLVSKIRKVSSAILYTSLAVSDLFLLLSVAFKVDYHLRGNNWVHGEAACRAVTACFCGNLYASAVTLAFISIKRYLAVVYPFMYKSLPKRTFTAWVTLGVWVVFVAAIVPELAVKQSYHVSDLDITTCHDVLANNDGFYNFLVPYNLVLIVLFLLVPLVVNVVCYTRVIYELNRTKLNSEEKTTFRVIVLTLVIFLLCFTPTVVLNLIRYVQVSVSNDDSLFVGFNVAVCLCCLHACVDPLLYIFRSESTRSILKDKLLKGKTSTICLRKN